MSVPTFIVVIILAIFCVPHLHDAVHNLQPLRGGVLKNWNGLVAIVLALSGVEAIANATGVMKLDPGSTPENPSVMKTAKPALLWIALEVCFLTAFLGLGMHALGGLHSVPGDSSGPDVDAPGYPGVRDYMLRHMGRIFVGGVFGPHVGEGVRLDRGGRVFVRQGRLAPLAVRIGGRGDGRLVPGLGRAVLGRRAGGRGGLRAGDAGLGPGGLSSNWSHRRWTVMT